MSAPGFVLAAVRPREAAKQVRAADKARSAAIERLYATVDARWPGLEAMCHQSFDGSFSVSGLAIKGPGFTSELPVPLGFRYDKKSRYLVPARKTDEGKALVRDLNALAFQYPRIEGLGGIVSASDHPDTVPSHKRNNYFTGWQFYVFGKGKQTQVFAAIRPAHLYKRDRLAINADRWVEAPLSAFHLAHEAAS